MIHVLELVSEGWGGSLASFSFTNYPMTDGAIAGLAWPWPSQHTT